MVPCEEMRFNKIKLDDAIRRLLNNAQLPNSSRNRFERGVIIVEKRVY